MTAPVQLLRPEPLRVGGDERTLAGWCLRFRAELVLLAVLLAIVAATHAANMYGWPQYFEDESTYVSQAWSVQTRGELAPYTYWYDHPPGGWLQMALWAWLTGAWDRLDSGVQVGRELALVTKLISSALLFVLARRLGMQLFAVAATVLLFALSPLSIYFQRMGLLDNMLLPWVLGAFVLVYSPRRRLVAYMGAAVLLAVACQIKITSGLFLPVLAVLVWQRVPSASRRYALTLFGVTFAFAGSFWFLMAILKGEFWPDTPQWFPGQEHVSLLGTQRWVLHMRGGAGGSILDPGSGAYYMLQHSLLRHDRWLLALGLACALLVLFVRRYRWIGVTYLLMTASIIRSNTLSWPYFSQFIPFAALAIGGVLDALWRQLRVWRVSPALAAGIVGSLATALVVAVAPSWWTYHLVARSHDANAVYHAAADWLVDNVPADSKVLLDNTLWMDLVLSGHEEQSLVWFWKLEQDHAVAARFPDHQAFDYVVTSGFVRETIDAGSVPETALALQHSRPVARFQHAAELDWPEPWLRRGALVSHGYVAENVEVRRIVPTPTATERPGRSPDVRQTDATSLTSRRRTPPAERAELEVSRGTPLGAAGESGVRDGPVADEATHVVVAGDTLGDIARRFGTTVPALAERNDLEDPDLILVGQVLVVPPGGER